MDLKNRISKILLKRTKKGVDTITPSQLDHGELMISYKNGEECIIFKNDNDELVKLPQIDPSVFATHEEIIEVLREIGNEDISGDPEQQQTVKQRLAAIEQKLEVVADYQEIIDALKEIGDEEQENPTSGVGGVGGIKTLYIEKEDHTKDQTIELPKDWHVLHVQTIERYGDFSTSAIVRPMIEHSKNLTLYVNGGSADGEIQFTDTQLTFHGISSSKINIFYL